MALEIRGPRPFVRLRPDTVDGGYGRVPAATQPAEKKPRQVSRADAERHLNGEMLTAGRELTACVRQLADQLAAPAVNPVLLVQLVTLDADGRWQYEGQGVIGSVLVGNHHATDSVTVQAGEGASAPASGVGVQMVAAGHSLPVALRSRVLTVWGTPGTQVSVQAFAGLQAYGAR